MTDAELLGLLEPVFRSFAPAGFGDMRAFITRDDLWLDSMDCGAVCVFSSAVPMNCWPPNAGPRAIDLTRAIRKLFTVARRFRLRSVAITVYSGETEEQDAQGFRVYVLDPQLGRQK